MRLRFLMPLAAALVAACSDGTTAPVPIASATSRGLRDAAPRPEMVNASFDIASRAYVACSETEAGTIIDISGRLHANFHLRYDMAGGSTITETMNMQGVTGVGIATGARYVATSNVQLREHIPGDHWWPDLLVSRGTQRFVATGGGESFTLRWAMRLERDVDGQLRPVLDEWDIDCN